MLNQVKPRYLTRWATNLTPAPPKPAAAPRIDRTNQIEKPTREQIEQRRDLFFSKKKARPRSTRAPRRRRLRVEIWRRILTSPAAPRVLMARRGRRRGGRILLEPVALGERGSWRTAVALALIWAFLQESSWCEYIDGTKATGTDSGLFVLHPVPARLSLPRKKSTGYRDWPSYLFFFKVLTPYICKIIRRNTSIPSLDLAHPRAR
jgi:hypothetical protein